MSDVVHDKLFLSVVLSLLVMSIKEYEKNLCLRVFIKLSRQYPQKEAL